MRARPRFSYLFFFSLLAFSLGLGNVQAGEAQVSSLHHIKPEACKQCHEEIYQQ